MSSIETAKKCGSCKWLDVPAGELTKAGLAHKRNSHKMYYCRVPFVMPIAPASFSFEIRSHGMMCPSYGENCTFHKRRSMPIIETPPNG